MTASRAGIPRQGDRHRPEPDRPHPALQPGDLYRRLHADPRLVRRTAGIQGAAAMRPAASASTSRAVAAKPARATASSRSRCTSCPMSMSTCDVCKGKRYNRETLEVKFRDHSIADVLDMTIEAGAELLRRRALHRRKAGNAETRRPGLYRHRPAGDDPVGRRGPARQAVQGIVAPRHRPHALHPRRAHHRPAFPRHQEIAGSAAASWWKPATPWW